MLLQTALEPELRAYAEIVEHSGRHLLGIINDILDISQIEAGKMSLESAALEPFPLVRDVARLLESQADAHGIALTT